MRHLFSILSGLLFGLGLIAAGMTQPLKVKGFLDLFGAWDPSLALVMAGAIAVGVIAFAAARRRSNSWVGDHIEIPNNRTIDGRLVCGGLLFGAGWGVAGYCPGPAIASLGTGFGPAWIFVAAMLAGMTIHDQVIIRSQAASKT